MTMTVYTPAQRDAWNDVLQECATYDFYHLPRYHQMAEEAGEGSAKLFVYREGGHTIALPLLIRPLGTRTDWHDATSVYGYAGPIASPGEIPQSVIANFQDALSRKLNELQVVSIFARLNTFLAQEHVLTGLGTCRTMRQTVSIDLTLPVQEQRARYRQSFKTAVNRLRRAGVSCVLDLDGAYLADFMEIYNETMRRVQARGHYYFSPEYFKQMLHGLGTNAYLFLAMHQEQPVCGALFVESCGILQYHLGGTRDGSISMAPMKFLMDQVRVWGTDKGFNVLHLGGGLTSSPDDSLFYFKTGFSDRLHDFKVWHWILQPEVYRRLCRGKAQRNRRRGLRAVDAEFFPAYRCPTVPRNPLFYKGKVMDYASMNGGPS